MIIIRLNFSGSGRLDPPAAGVTVTEFYDVSGDNFLSPLDALLVINGINFGARPQGEAPPAASQFPNNPFDIALWQWMEEEEEQDAWWTRALARWISNLGSSAGQCKRCMVPIRVDS